MAPRRQPQQRDGTPATEPQIERGAYSGHRGLPRRHGKNHCGNAANSVDIYAAVDLWRAHPGDQESNLRTTTGSVPTYQIPAFVPTASTYHPTSGHNQVVVPPHPSQTQPWRTSTGVQTRHYWQESEEQASQPNPPTRHNYTIRPKPAPIAKIYEEIAASAERQKRSTYTPDVRPSIEKPDFPLPNSAIDLFQQRPKSQTPRRTVSPPPAPQARPQYLQQAQLEPVVADKAQKLLIALDLNGTLVFRPIAPGGTRKSGHVVERPGMQSLLSYLFANHVVMVYTSARIENAELMASQIFTKEQRSMLAAVYARDKLDLNNAQFRGKVQVYKKLDKIWRDKKIQSKCIKTDIWDQRNTILVDDSHLKALAQPHNLLQVPEFKGIGKTGRLATIKRQEDIMQSLIVKLEVLKWHKDISRVIRRWQTGSLDIPKVPGSGVVVDEKVDQKNIVDAEDKAEVATGSELLTPRSPASEESSGDINGVGLVVAETRSITRGPVPNNFQTKEDWRNSQTRLRSESPIPESTWKELLGETVED